MGGGLLRHHRSFLVGFQVMPIFAGLVTGSASALTSYLSSRAHGMVVHVKNYLSLSYRLRPFKYKLDDKTKMESKVVSNSFIFGFINILFLKLGAKVQKEKISDK